jgi:hypothetical protein
VTDVENYLAQVWSPDVRPLVEEAWRSYNAGAIRAAIAATWTAVNADIIIKLGRLADDGDTTAATFQTNVTKAQDLGITPEGVRAMQSIEDNLLTEAANFELIDTIGVRELKRIREDRNLCVHPSLRPLGEVYDPRPEVARAHLAVALSTLLVHPPTQGRKAVEDFTNYICDPLFVATAPHIQAAFFDRVRVATRGNIIKVAAKHALLETPLPPSVQLSSTDVADRMASALSAFALRDREFVRTTVVDLHSRFQRVDGAAGLRALIRLGDQDYFWDMIDEPTAARFNAMLTSAAVPADPWTPFPADTALYFASVRNDIARNRLPILEQRFNTMSLLHRMAVVHAHPDPYFIEAVIDFMKNAYSFRTGEQVGLLAVLHAPYFNTEALEALLAEWAANIQCREAKMMPELAVSLFRSTAHLGHSRIETFRGFLETVRGVDPDPDPYYTYLDLGAALSTT